MIATISGVVVEKSSPLLVIESGGIGYGVMSPVNDYELISIDKEVRLYIHEVIREDAYDLYGFIEVGGRELFRQLLSVSGVGPKAALAILSLGGYDRLVSAIGSEDIAYLQTASGIGKRTAERIAVELKDKVSNTYSGTVSSPRSEVDAAQEALEALGYTRQVAAIALSQVSVELSDEERIKQALKGL